MANLKASLQGAGIPQNVADKVMKEAEGQFTTVPLAKVGNDAFERDKAKAISEATDRLKQLGFDGEIATKAKQEEIMKDVSTWLKEYANPGSDRYRSYLNQISKFIQTGVVINNPNDPNDKTEYRVIPSKAGLQQLVQQMDRGWEGTANFGSLFGDNWGYNNDLSVVFNKWKDNPQIKENAADLIRIAAKDRVKGATEIMSR